MTTLPIETTTRISPASINITPTPKPAFVKSDEKKAADAEFFKSLRLLKAKCGKNRDDQAYACVVACIGYGINTRKRITAALGVLDFHFHHVDTVLNTQVGDDPDVHPWRRDARGFYWLNK
jgi:hypothetical protein